jgi:hypothetical protein
MIERKCLNCGTWNGAQHFCTSCHTAISPEAIQKSENAVRAQELLLQKPDKLDLLFDKAKHSRFLLVRILFYILYSVGFIVFAIGAFAAYLIAWYPV